MSQQFPEEGGAYSTGGTSTTGQTRQKASGKAQQAKEQVGEKAQQAKEKVQETAQRTRGVVAGQVDQRSTQVGERIGSTASDARSVAQELRNQGKDTPARVVEQVADRVDRFGDYLQESDGDRLIRDVEDLARRQPWLVAASALALGFAASRFLKASSSRRYEERERSENGDRYRYATDDGTTGYDTGAQVPGYDVAGYPTSTGYTDPAYGGTVTTPVDPYQTTPADPYQR